MKKLYEIVKKDNSKVLGGNLLASLFGLLNFMLMIRITSKFDFGLIVIFLSAAGLADLIRTGFVRQGLVREWVMNDAEDKSNLIGSSWLLHLLIGGVIVLLCYMTMAGVSLLSLEIDNYILLIQFYPLLLLASIPHQMESWLAQGKKHYLTMNVFRLAVNIIFFLILIFNYGGQQLSAIQIIQYLILSHAGVSLIALIKLRSIREIRNAKWNQIVSLFNFGKYSLSTLAGSNLLKSTDTLLIGLLINAESAAIYAIPFKVIELLEIPLRGFVMTSFHSLTQWYKLKNQADYSRHFQLSVLRLTLVFLPVVLVSLLVPHLVVEFLGGADYSESVYILQVLAFAMLIMPLDKFAGMALDSNNQPDVNAKKVWMMVGVNLIGDLLIITLGGPLWMIASITILNILFGVSYGIIRNHFLRLSININWAQLIPIH
ncbi:MAG: oligosaccharide flippase family protein [Cyclobacteriaceae bacterium]